MGKLVAAIVIILTASVDALGTLGSVGAMPNVKGEFTVIENAQTQLKCDIPPSKPARTIPLDYCVIKLKDSNEDASELKVLGYGDECKVKVGDEIKTELEGFDCEASLITCNGKESDQQWVYYLKNKNQLGCHVEGVGYRFGPVKRAKALGKKK